MNKDMVEEITIDEHGIYISIKGGGRHEITDTGWYFYPPGEKRVLIWGTAGEDDSDVD